MPRRRLVFVYNADSGAFNTALDIAHKLFSPSTYTCRLCALTHTYFKVSQVWQEFVPHLDADCEFIHRDEFRQRYPDLAPELPAIFLIRNGRPEVWLARGAIESCNDLPQLMQTIQDRLQTTR